MTNAKLVFNTIGYALSLLVSGAAYTVSLIMGAGAMIAGVFYMGIIALMSGGCLLAVVILGALVLVII